MISTFIYVSELLQSPRSTTSYDWVPMATYIWIFVAIIFSIITLLIRHFAVIKPYKNGEYNPHLNFARFFATTIVNLILSCSVVCLGMLSYSLGGEIWVLYFLSVLGFILFLFHSPRLSQFKKDSIVCSKDEEQPPKGHNPFTDYIFTTCFVLMLVIAILGDDCMQWLAGSLHLSSGWGVIFQSAFSITFMVLSLIRGYQLKKKQLIPAAK